MWQAVGSKYRKYPKGQKTFVCQKKWQLFSALISPPQSTFAHFSFSSPVFSLGGFGVDGDYI
jgi:hypothetical protein